MGYGRCLGVDFRWYLAKGMMCKHFLNIPLDSFLIAASFCSQWPWDSQNLSKLGVSVRCLEGVWEVSGGCLSDCGLWFEGMICKQFIYIPFDSFLLAACFTPTGIVWTKSAQILGVCGVSWRCLEGVWKGLGIVWDDSGYCLGGMMCKQLINTQWTNLC